MTSFDAYRFGPFVLDTRRWCLERDGEPIALQPKVFKTLLYLVQHPGRVIPKQELFAELWPATIVTDGVLTRCIKELRQALDDQARDARFIRTAWRVGYAFVADVQGERTADAASSLAIAVLPFKPLVAVERDEALELGLADDLINQLSSVKGLVVRPLSAVRRYGGLEQDPLAAGREQRADIVIDGTLQQSGDELRVAVRVLKVADATSLLAEALEGRIDEPRRLQLGLGRRVAEALELAVTPRESEALAGRATGSPAAYRCFLLGRLHAGRHTPEGDRRSIELFRQAVAADPDYALAWAALAEGCISLGTLETDAGHFAQARDCATRALALQSDLVPAMTCLGTIAWLHDWDWSGAEQHFRRALTLAPGNAGAQIAYSDFCAYLRQYEAAIAAAGRAVEIDPTSPWVHALLAQALHMAGLHDEAIAEARRALEIAPDFAFAHFFAGLSSMMCRRWPEGIGHIEEAHRHSARGDFAGALGWAYAVAGHREAALEVLAGLEVSGGLVPPIIRAPVYLGLGQDDRTLDLLEQAVDERDWHVLLLYAEPAFRRLRTHPRAVRLLGRLHLPTSGSRAGGD
jgi:DNA-binding winged helix-turn-helix (wHTH) protein/Tfp pilus assembly protein PilF